MMWMVLIMEIGNTLREAREQQNLSLDDIQDKTKIQKRYLAAIENNNLDILPGRFYARAFIKEYALVVGLDVIELLADFDENNMDYEQPEVVQSSRLNRMKKRDTGGTSRFLSFLPTVIVILLVIGIVFVAWTLITKTLTDDTDDTPGESDHIIRKPGQDNAEPAENNEDNDEEATTDVEEEEVEEEEEEEEVTEVEATFEVTDLGTGNPPTSEMSFTYTGDKVEIVLTPTADTYVDLKGETESYVGATLAAETEPLTFDISEETDVYLNIGNTDGLDVTINDVVLEYPAEVVWQKIQLKLIREE